MDESGVVVSFEGGATRRCEMAAEVRWRGALAAFDWGRGGGDGGVLTVLWTWQLGGGWRVQRCSGGRAGGVVGCVSVETELS